MTTPNDQPTPNNESVRVSRGRSVVLHLSLVLFAVALLVRAGKVQLVEGEYWAARGNNQRNVLDTLPAPRGRIVDDNGVPLAVSREQVKLIISPNQLRAPTEKRNDRDTLINELTRLGVPRAVVRRAADTTRKYVAINKLFLPSEVKSLLNVRGVTAERTMQRIPSGPDGLQGLVGRVNAQGEGATGLELSLDSLLTGTVGELRTLRDARGRLWSSPQGSEVRARPGHTVKLTINRQYQELIERELLLAMQRTGASGGDLVVVNPNDGAILGMAGARDGRIANNARALTEAYEPGSVLKPMFVARLIEQGRTTASSMINTEGGVWRLDGRPFEDTHKEDALSVFDVIRWSSNIGTVKLVTGLMSRDETYELLRDYGFGTMSGLPYPSETPGILRQPAEWTSLSAASLSMGYEIAVTPVQLAMAYAALANGGELLEPALIREVRAPDSTLVFRHERRVVRRVASEQSAAQVREMLKAVVDSGTGRAAGLTVFEVGGKTGTARQSSSIGTGEKTYDATFAGMFPMSDPQLVVVARMINPQGEIFGGLVAGPMVRGVLLGALSARSSSIDRRVLQRVAQEIALPADSLSGNARSGDASASRRVVNIAGASAGDVDSLHTMPIEPAPRDVEPTPGRVIVALPYAAEEAPAPVREMRTIPSVRGLSTREAARTLFAAGFDVQLQRGVPGRTRPEAGRSARQGTIVVLETTRQ